MQKPKDPDLDLITNFIGTAGRYLEGGADNPKFKPIVAWALENIPLLNEQIVEASAFNNWEAGQLLKAAMDKRLDEYHKRAIDKRIDDFIDATEGLSPDDHEQIRQGYYRRQKASKSLPDELRTEIEDIIIHAQTHGKYLELSKEKQKFWAEHDADFEKMLDDAPTTPGDT